MQIKELQKQLEGNIEGFTPVIGIGYDQRTGEEIEKLNMMLNGHLVQVFGVTQSVLDVIDLTEEELIKYIIKWTEACGKAREIRSYLEKIDNDSSAQSVKEEES